MSHLTTDICAVTGKPLNRFGRPDNWADRAVERLLHAHAVGGRLASSSEWLEIQEEDKPTSVAAQVASGRFNQIIQRKTS